MQSRVERLMPGQWPGRPRGASRLCTAAVRALLHTSCLHNCLGPAVALLLTVSLVTGQCSQTMQKALHRSAVYPESQIDRQLQSPRENSCHNLHAGMRGKMSRICSLRTVSKSVGETAGQTELSRIPVQCNLSVCISSPDPLTRQLSTSNCCLPLCVGFVLEILTVRHKERKPGIGCAQRRSSPKISDTGALHVTPCLCLCLSLKIYLCI